MIGVLIAFLLPQRLDRKMLSTSGGVDEAVLAAAVIILITASGKVLQNAGIATVLGTFLAERGHLGVLLPFVIAAPINPAQGSSTVSIITTASLMAPLLP
jgi:GntP family gluconate:H+ symporter